MEYKCMYCKLYFISYPYDFLPLTGYHILISKLIYQKPKAK